MTELTLSGTGLLISVLAIALAIGLVIYGLRFWYLRLSNEKQKLTNEEKHLPRASSRGSIPEGLKSRNKYQELDVFAITKPVWMFGLGTALLFTLFAFSWEQKDPQVYIPDGAMDPIEEEHMIRTSPPPPPKPPPPPPPPPIKIEEVPEEMVEDEPDFESMEVDAETDIADYEPAVEEGPPPPPPPPPPIVEDDVPPIWNIVEEMPRFPGCEDFDGTKEEKAKCAEQKMLEYIYGKVKYPAIARENGIEGRAILQFVVTETGSITDVTIVRDIAGGCGKAAEVVVDGFPNWIPGKQGGRKVSVRYTLPVVFKLHN